MVSTAILGGVKAGEYQARLQSWWTMVAFTRRYVKKGITIVARVYSLMLH
jgi:hypothetical protein